MPGCRNAVSGTTRRCRSQREVQRNDAWSGWERSVTDVQSLDEASESVGQLISVALIRFLRVSLVNISIDIPANPRGGGGTIRRDGGREPP